MVRNDGAFLAMVIVGIFDMINAKIIEARNAQDIKQKNTPRFGYEGNFNRIEAKTDRFTSTQDTSKYADVMGKLLG